MRVKLLTLFLFIQVCSLTLVAQIPVGSWRGHLSFNDVISVTSNGNQIISASESGLFFYDKAANEINKLTRLDGLSDAGIVKIGYSKATSTLVIAYENGNIDLIRDREIINFPDLLLNDRINSKVIHHMLFLDDLVYLSADFGIMILDLSSIEVKETLLGLGVLGETIPINASAIADDSLYAATSEGVMVGALKDNLKDYSLWYRFSAIDGLDAGAGTAISQTDNGLLSAISGAGLFLLNSGNWLKLNLLENDAIKSMVYDSKTVITTGSSIYHYANSQVSPVVSNLATSPVDGLYEDNQNWLGDLGNGLVSVNSGIEKSIFPNGPANNNQVKLRGSSDQIVALSPAYDANFNPIRNNAGISIFVDESWVVYSSSGRQNTISIPDFLDVTDAAIGPDTQKSIFSSFGYGLLVKDGNVFTIIDENTPGSLLENIIPPGRNVYVSALSQNYQGTNLINYEASTPLLRVNNTEQWQSFTPPFTNSQKSQQLISTNWDDHWMVINPNFGGGIVLFNEQGAAKYLSTGQNNGGLPSSKIYEILLDKEDKLWVATDKGVVYYPYPQGILDEPITDPVIPIYERNPLFANQPVTALAVDGGNRLWMASNQGAWLFADDGQTLVAHFNTENSPLLANNIADISIVAETGEVFFATEKGLISFRGTATDGIEATDVKIFPNPVYPGYTGLITMEGVPANASVTITDVSGRLVYKTTSEGNSAVWDGRDAYGQKVPSGVYFVFIATEDKSKKQAGKIVIIN